MQLPNIITLFRIAAIPLIIAMYYVDWEYAKWAALILFVLSAISDWLDGYLARLYKMTSSFGRFLDPIADKLAVTAILVMLVYTNRIAGLDVIAAYLILARELFISGLREYLGGFKDPVVMPVSIAAKWKTAMQMTALIALLAIDAWPLLEPLAEIAGITLWIAAILSVTTGYEYFKATLKYIDT